VCGVRGGGRRRRHSDRHAPSPHRPAHRCVQPLVHRQTGGDGRRRSATLPAARVTALACRDTALCHRRRRFTRRVDGGPKRQPAHCGLARQLQPAGPGLRLPPQALTRAGGWGARGACQRRLRRRAARGGRGVRGRAALAVVRGQQRGLERAVGVRGAGGGEAALRLRGAWDGGGRGWDGWMESAKAPQPGPNAATFLMRLPLLRTCAATPARYSSVTRSSPAGAGAGDEPAGASASAPGAATAGTSTGGGSSVDGGCAARSSDAIGLRSPSAGVVVSSARGSSVCGGGVKGGATPVSITWRCGSEERRGRPS
jgi:hypothetical protein